MRSDPLLAGLAVLTVFSEHWAERPLTVLIDDEQWLDRATAGMLALVARRLRAQRVGMLFAASEPTVETVGLPELTISGRHSHAREVFDAAVTGPIDPAAHHGEHPGPDPHAICQGVDMDAMPSRRRRAVFGGAPLMVLNLVATVVGVPSASAQPVKPTVVLVHGAWADTSGWDGEVSALQADGYDVRAIANPLRNLTTDAETVSGFLKTVPGPVVLVGHSYGGSVITNAAEGNTNVKALVYVDAAAPDVGETNGSLSGADSVLKQKPEAELFDKLSYPGAPVGAVDLYLKKDIFLSHFGNDLPADVATRLWATQRAASTAAFDTPSRFAAWKSIPSWYFISSGDQIITPTSERAIAARAGSHITVFDGGSHLTLISHPDAVTAVILDAAQSVS